MSLFAKARKAKENKKGFTLVELIVVLVILAILAAILVPALLGWIDEAKKKQYVLEARSVYMAMQAIADEEYARVGDSAAIMTLNESVFCQTGKTALKSSVQARIKELSDITVNTIQDVDAKASNVTGIDSAEKKHQAYTIRGMGITFTSQDETEVGARLENGTWSINTAAKGSKVTIPGKKVG